MPSSVSSHQSGSHVGEDRPEVPLSIWWKNSKLNDARGMMYGLIRDTNDQFTSMFYNPAKQKKRLTQRFPKEALRTYLAEGLQPPRPEMNIVCSREHALFNGRDPETDNISEQYDDTVRREMLSCEDWFLSMVTTWIYDSNLAIVWNIPFTVKHNEITSTRTLPLNSWEMRDTYGKNSFGGDNHFKNPVDPNYRSLSNSNWALAQYPYGKPVEIMSTDEYKSARDGFVWPYIELIELSLSALSVQQEQHIRSKMDYIFDRLEPILNTAHQQRYLATVKLDHDTNVFLNLQKELFSEVQDYFVYGVSPPTDFSVAGRAASIVTARIISEKADKSEEITITEINEWIHRNGENKYYRDLSRGKLDAKSTRTTWLPLLSLESAIECKTKDIRQGKH